MFTGQAVPVHWLFQPRERVPIDYGWMSTSFLPVYRKGAVQRGNAGKTFNHSFIPNPVDISEVFTVFGQVVVLTANKAVGVVQLDIDGWPHGKIASHG